MVSERARVWAALSALNPSRVLVGCCPSGADRFAREWCRAHGVPFRRYVAQWGMFGRRAGPRRNQQMIDAAPEGSTVLAFPRGGPGTADCIRRAVAAGLEVVQR